MIERLSAACPLQPDGRLRASLLGHIHRIADRRLAAIGAGGLIAAIATVALALAALCVALAAV